VTTRYSLDNIESQRPTQPLSSGGGTPAVRSITALGRLEPRGEVRKLSAATSIQGAKVDQLLVEQGDQVRADQVVAVLDTRARLQAALERAQKQVKVAQANLERVRAGAKAGTIAAQAAKIQRIEAELKGEKEAQQTKINRLNTQLQETGQAQAATLQAQGSTIRRLEAELRNVQEDFERYQQLKQDGAISPSELESRRLRVETAIERLSEAQANLSQAQANRNQTLANLREELTEAEVTRNKTLAVLEAQINEAKATQEEIKEVRPVDIQQSESEVDSALAAVGQAQADLESAYVRAPVGGRILKINARAGETIDDKQGIAELGQTTEMIVVAEVYESDIRKVRLGQRVTITSEGKAFEGELRGTVSQVGLQIGKKDILNTDPAADVDSRVVEVNIRLNQEDGNRVAGLTYSKVMVEILL
jgi:HlyD family secretion protein